LAQEPALQEGIKKEDTAEVSERRATQSTDGSPPLLQCDGPALKRLSEAALYWLEQHSDSINALNVFPVPDGDTGTNMLLTMKSAWKEIAESSEPAVGAVAHDLAYGALMGARGNSGVILSQLLRGFASVLEGLETFGVRELAEALKEASATAYKGVIKPVEGTILTVSRDIATIAKATARETDDLRTALERIVRAARKSVAETPRLLPVLAEAGVVDAGGQGLFVIMEGMLRYLQGESVIPQERLAKAGAGLPAPAPAGEEYGYDIQFLLQGEGLDLPRIRDEISAMGDSVLVVGDDHTIKVHIHSPDPGRPLSYATQIGAISDVVVENLQEQYQEFVGATVPASTTAQETTNIAVVVVIRGEGFTQVFKSLGASAIVPGGQTMNPSTEELLHAIDSLPNEDVIVLPNNPNVVLAAQQAESLSSKRVRVVPTRTIPEGIAALLAFNYQADLDTNVKIMSEGTEYVETGEVTTAVRAVHVNGVQVEEGQTIGLLNGRLVTSGESIEGVIEDLLHRMEADQAEILTIYYGEDVSEEDAQHIAGLIRQWFPEQEAELVSGGQPHYLYILSAE